MLEVFYSAALGVSELVGLKKYRMERSSGPRLWQNSKERLCPLGQPAIDAMIHYGKRTRDTGEKNQQGAEPVLLLTVSKYRLEASTRAA